jgi:hypothetical protein
VERLHIALVGESERGERGLSEEAERWPSTA